MAAPIAEAKAKNTIPASGTPCRTAATLGTTTGMMVVKARLDLRTPGIDGVTRGWVPGHGGDVWWVEHVDGSVAAYTSREVIDREPG